MGFAIVRVLRYGSSLWRRHMLLHSAVSYQRPSGGRRIQRLCAIFQHSSKSRVGTMSARNPNINSDNPCSLYQSCGILGATVMPHSLFLGSGVVQSRLKDFDVTQGYVDASAPVGSTDEKVEYRPSVHAIRTCMKYSIIELVLSLFTFALFVNSSIVIVAGASLYNTSSSANADLFGIYRLLSDSISSAAGLIYALSLLLSGISAGIVCTMAGQIVSEGMLKWSIRPWLRRVITRSISVVPSIVIAGAVGKDGLNEALKGSQVVLSVILPFVTAPLIYFTCRSQYMTVRTDRMSQGEETFAVGGVKMRNNFLVCAIGLIIWLILVVMNVALIVLIGLGRA